MALIVNMVSSFFHRSRLQRHPRTPQGMMLVALALWCLLPNGPILGQDEAKKPSENWPESVLNPLVPSSDSTRMPNLEPLLPQGRGVDVNDYENPLLLFEDGPKDLPIRDELNPDLLPPLVPLPGDTIPTVPLPLQRPPTEQDKRLMQLGAKVAKSVLGIRVWDEFGSELASGIGAFVSENGVVLTDAGLLHPEWVEKIDYVTGTSADGSSFKINGFYEVDLQSGVALLKADRKDTAPLSIRTNADLATELPCLVLAISERRGLVLADATVQTDSSATGLGWLNVEGSDSPGAVGSPVIDMDGHAVAIVGMKVPLQNWMNFALPIDQAAFASNRKRPPLRPWGQLPRSPKLAEVAKDPKFLDAFESLQKNRFEPALRKWIQLTARYPRSAECWALLGLCASYMGGKTEALNCQRKAVALDPKSGLYWHQLALAKLREQGAEGTESLEDREALERAVTQRPDDQSALLLLASRYVRDGDYGLADETLQRLTMLAPNYAQGFYLRAYVRGRLRDYSGAEQAIKRSLKLNPNSAEAWYYQGLIFDWKGEYLDAAEAFKKATRYSPQHPQAWLNLAHAYRKAGRSTEARQAFITHQKLGSGE